jgi:putative membrane protein
MRKNLLVAAAGLVALAACAKDKGGASDSAAMADSATMAKVTPTADTSARLTDANIAALLDEANAGDSATGNLATTRGTKADVKAFGKLMMNDHHAMRKQGQDLATKLNVTPTPPANDSLPAKAKAEQDNLTAMDKGAGWDKAYIDGEVEGHQMVLRLIDQAQAAAQAPELKDLLSKARPNIETHLKRAQDIQAKLGADSTKKK